MEGSRNRDSTVYAAVVYALHICEVDNGTA